MSIDMADAELSQLFDHSGGWAQGMIARYMRQIQSGDPLTRGRPRLAESKREKNSFTYA
jgi:hypothetical protein